MYTYVRLLCINYLKLLKNVKILALDRMSAFDLIDLDNLLFNIFMHIHYIF